MGKQFVKDASGATSCEISFGTLPAGESVPFFHSHKENEENYIILSGKADSRSTAMCLISLKVRWSG